MKTRSIIPDRRSVVLFFLAAGLVALAGCGKKAEETAADTTAEVSLDWPQFRGPGGSGVAPDAGELPTRWSAESPNVRWQTAIPGNGNSSPIVAGGRVFLTTAYLADQETGGDGGAEKKVFWRAVVAVGLDDGQIAWQTPIFKAPAEKIHHLSTLAPSTPVTDGRHVFAYFGSTLASLDLDGKIVWQKEIEPDYARFSRYGAANSPVLTHDAVIVAQDQERADTEDVGWIAAFDRATGERIWRQEWDHTCCSYTTPTVYRNGEDEHVLFYHAGSIVAYDARSGEPVWKHEHPAIQPVPSLVVDGDLLCVTGGVNDERTTGCFQIAGTGAETHAELLWQEPKRVPKTPTPLFYEGQLLVLADNGTVNSFDPRTGTVNWVKRLAAGSYLSSPVAGDQKVYFTARNGLTTVLAAQKNFPKIAENHLERPTGTRSPAIGGGCLLIRTEKQLFCIEKKGEPAEEKT